MLFPAIMLGQVIDLEENTSLFGGKGTAHYLDTTSTAQSKNGKLTLNDTLRLTDLATSNITVLSPDANGDIDSTETSDISEITIDTLDVNYIEANNRILVGDGTGALPSISFINDPNSGLYSYGDNAVAISNDGVLRWIFLGNRLDRKSVV